MSSTGYGELAGFWRRTASLLRRAGDLLARRTSGPRVTKLQHVIESQIVPRLVIADGAPDASGRRLRASWEPTADDVGEFTRLLLEHDAGVALAYVDVLFSKGASAESVCLGLLASAARRLGSLSANGEVAASRVMTAQDRLREVLRAVERGRAPGYAGDALAEPSGGA